MKRTLMTLMTVGALAIPVGVLTADADQGEPVDPTPATVRPERDRDRERRHVDDPAVLGEQPQFGSDECPDPATRTRHRAEIRVEDGTGEGPQAHEREQHRVEEGTGEGPQAHEREQHRVEAGTGEGPQAHEREQHRIEEGTGDDGTESRTQEPTAADDGANLHFRYGADRNPGNR